jgi:glucosamine-6-phosphate deaminase
MDVKIMPDKGAMGKAAAAAGAEHIRSAIAARGAANIIVATGASQFEMLAALVAEPNINWNVVTGFHLDEYVGLPISHPASFRGYLWQRFVSQLPFPMRAFHFLNGEGDPQAECRRVAEVLAKQPIDVAFVGIGENGHLAFNDPPADFETEAPYLVVQLDDACRRQQLGEGWFPTFDDVPQKAISMSVRQIMKSAAIICTVPDERKAEAVRNTVEGDVSPSVPASILQRHKQCTIYLDVAAASKLKK